MHDRVISERGERLAMTFAAYRQERQVNTYMDSTFSESYDRHVTTVYRVCYSILGNATDAEDAVQSVFVKLLENDRRFTDSEHEKAWLITTARNHCLDMHRNWWRKSVIKQAPSFFTSLKTTSHSNGEMDDYLRKLPAKYRLLLYLYYYEGYKISEIANMLKLNDNTVKTQMRSARKRLKMEVGDDFHE